MHNIKREDYAKHYRDKSSHIVKQIATYKKLSDLVVSLKKRGARDEKSLDLSAKLIALNPDFNTVWNFRKEAVNDLLQKCTSEEDKLDVCLKELEISKLALHKNPKSYPSWFHRKWILAKEILPKGQLQREVALTSKLLKFDERNFHCWTYRREVVSYLQLPLVDEFRFTTEKIEENFSNYSAWHYRANLITQMARESCSKLTFPESMPTTFKSEMELLAAAFYTAPRDLSAWMYHNWLLAREFSTSDLLSLLGRRKEGVKASDCGVDSNSEVLTRKSLREIEDLARLDDKSVWPKFSIVLMLSLLAWMDNEELLFVERRKEILKELANIDKMRANLYRELDTKVQ